MVSRSTSGEVTRNGSGSPLSLRRHFTLLLGTEARCKDFTARAALLSIMEGSGKVATPSCLWEVKQGWTSLVQTSAFCNTHRDTSKAPSTSIWVILTAGQWLVLLFMSDGLAKRDTCFKGINIINSFTFASVVLIHCWLPRGGFGKCRFLRAAGRRSGAGQTHSLLTLPQWICIGKCSSLLQKVTK